MVQLVLVVLSQLAFTLFRTLNVKYTAHGKLIGAMFTGLMVNILWIGTTWVGIAALNNHDWVTAAGYLLGGQIGVFYGMRQNQIVTFWKVLACRLFHRYQVTSMSTFSISKHQMHSFSFNKYSLTVFKERHTKEDAFKIFLKGYKLRLTNFTDTLK